MTAVHKDGDLNTNLVSTVMDIRSKCEAILRWGVITRTAVLSNFIHSLNYKITTFRKLDSAPSSGKKGNMAEKTSWTR